MSHRQLLDSAIKTLRLNDAGIFTKPGPRQYPHQWNWDSALIALGLSYFDLPRALVEVRSLLSGQWKDGLLPHIIYHDQPSDYFPTAAFWGTQSNPNCPPGGTSGITQPPLLTTILRRIHQRIPIKEFISEVFSALMAWHRWLHSARDADGSRLAAIIHPWESGTDDSPRWLTVMQAIQPMDVPEFKRGDLTHVRQDERPYQPDYERFMYLISIFRKHGYDPAALMRYSPFLVQDVLFNAILHQADQDLEALALELDRPTVEIRAWLQAYQAGFTRAFWHEHSGLFLDYDLQNKLPIQVNTAATFTPLFAGLASPEQAARLVRDHLNNPDEYAPTADQPYMLTSTSRREPAWDPRRYWRGPVWIIMNWLVSHGLARYGYEGLAEQIKQHSVDLMIRSGFREYYDPRDGSGCGSIDFSWSAALAIDWLWT